MVIPVLLLILNVMCTAPNLDTENFTANRPTDLTGIYTPTKSSWAFIKNEGGYTVTDISVTLAPDGSLTMTNIPDWWSNGRYDSNNEVESCQGKWGVKQVQSWYELSITCRTPTLISSSSVPIVGERPPYQLWFYIGDPDSGDVMIFEWNRP